MLAGPVAWAARVALGLPSVASQRRRITTAKMTLPTRLTVSARSEAKAMRSGLMVSMAFPRLWEKHKPGLRPVGVSPLTARSPELGPR